MSSDHIRAGRLSADRSGTIASYLASMDADRWIARADLRVDMAHLLMLTRQDIVDRVSAQQVMKELLHLYRDGLPESVFDTTHEDIHAGIEGHLIDVVGLDAGGRLHIGRSRNDEVATCIRLRLREELCGLLSEINHLRAVFLSRARAETETVMPGFTHLQHAQPTTLAHWMLSYETAFTRDFGRFRDALLRINTCPLGAAAFAGTGYPLDREMTAALLGFDRPHPNSMDAVAGRDFAIEAISACSILMTAISRICEELILWSSSLVAFVNLDDAYCSTSSIMPQKKNPDTAEIMRGKTGTVTGAFFAAQEIAKGLPMSYNRDLQELTPHLWTAISATRDSVVLLAGMIETAEFNRARMKEEAGKGFSTATDLADFLVCEYNLPFRLAHHITGRAVRSGVINLETLEAAAQEMGAFSLIERGLDEQTVTAALDPQASVAMRNLPGGPAPDAINQCLVKATVDCTGDETWTTNQEKHFKAAEIKLILEAEELINHDI